MTPVEEILADEIRRDGPISFHRFMEAALYHPVHGYYRRTEDPFGKHGDFYTAEQIQPVFGLLIAVCIRFLVEEMGDDADFTVVELGAGRGEMIGAFSGFRYIPLEVGDGELPDRFRGVVFSNEFFDALPVHRVVWRDGVARESLVGRAADRFLWVEGEPVSDEIEDYARRYFPQLPERRSAEVNLEALRTMERIAASLESGYVLTIDYGYTSAESKRFPDGTLMSYRRHLALEDVLAEPGARDITSHVCFSALREHGVRHGLETVRFETLAQTLLRSGEADQFASVLEGDDLRRRMQLKTLLFGMGETFRTLLQKKKKAPIPRGL